tara:strand:+ start:862 stop:1704 length:843 start_codon:yes stop_codon:yes gene_type:complete
MSVSVVAIWATEKLVADDETRKKLLNCLHQNSTEQVSESCLSNDLVICSEHMIDQETVDQLRSDNKDLSEIYCWGGLIKNDIIFRMFSSLKKRSNQWLEHNKIKLELMGIRGTIIRDERAEQAWAEYSKRWVQMVLMVRQLRTVPTLSENDAIITIAEGIDFAIPHDVGRYHKILWNEQGINYGENKVWDIRPPINSARMLFTKDRSNLHKLTIGQGHCLHHLTHPEVVKQVMIDQINLDFNTLFEWPKDIYDLLIRHLGIKVITFDEFDEFEKKYWETC